MWAVLLWVWFQVSHICDMVYKNRWNSKLEMATLQASFWDAFAASIRLKHETPNS